MPVTARTGLSQNQKAGTQARATTHGRESKYLSHHLLYPVMCTGSKLGEEWSRNTLRRNADVLGCDSVTTRM